MRKAFLVFLAVLVTASTSAAQESRIALLEQQQAEKARELKPQGPPPGQRLINQFEHLFVGGVKGFVPTFGGTRAGSGLATGLAYVMHPGDAQFKTRALWSTGDTRRVQSTLRLPIAGSAAVIDGFWEDAQGARWFGYGMADNAPARKDPLEQRGVSADVEIPVHGPFLVNAGIGYLRADTRSVGVASWRQTWIGAAIDRRRAADYTRDGFLYSVRAEHVQAQRTATDSFNRLTLDARHYVPLLHEHWVVAMQVRAELTDATDNTPYYLMPALGGGDSLRGYHSYRFIGRQSLLGRAELRWTAARTVDFAMFIDHGAVARRLGDLRVGDLARGWGFGARFHGDRETGFRFSLAHGGDGWQVHVSRQASF